MIRSSLASRIVVLVASLLAVSASALQAADESLLLDDFESGLYLWSDAVGLAAGEVCYRPDAPEIEWTEWSGTCAPDLLCCGCGLFPCEFKCFDGPECPIAP